ncbi:hypothetical protein [Streptomyces sp. NPDC007369]
MTARGRVEVEHRPDSVTVWANGRCFHIRDREGNEFFPDDHGCPAAQPAT